ncbi:hypothetical protein FSP39_004522 [Pinctada imbricata]|uniref:Tyr recombinase domain-containing protein n=1 Tax=Pinctada imbricata TaxID=66713 RepID=A0AA89C0I5_PINIB|nr:hypothetical protein FSP39_004522 [Pinctada imbricata]
MQPQSVKLYVSFVGTFCQWLSGSGKWLRYLQITAGKMEIIANVCKNTAKALISEVNKNMLERKALGKDELLLTPEMIRNYIDSDRFTQAVNQIASAMTKKLNNTMRIQVRDTLLLYLAMTNFRRTGDVPHLTKEVVLTAKAPEEGEKAELQIFRHKEAKSGQVCSLWVDEDQLVTLQNFAKYVCWAKPGVPYLFTAASGQELSSSTASKALKSEWNKYKTATNQEHLPDITGNTLRHLATSTAREKGCSRQEQELLAMQMSHSLATADKYYDQSRRALERMAVTDKINLMYSGKFQKEKAKAAAEGDKKDVESTSSSDTDSSEGIVPPSTTG